jgi:hypothetical protein
MNARSGQPFGYLRHKSQRVPLALLISVGRADSASLFCNRSIAWWIAKQDLHIRPGISSHASITFGHARLGIGDVVRAAHQNRLETASEMDN